MESPSAVIVAPVAAAQTEHLSYKFQRLRERLRQAVVSGELSGKLPGERGLAKVFRANPKTLSKALTDLAAEGLLERSIGRGTYVKGTPTQQVEIGQWLVLTDASAESQPLVDALRQRNSAIECVSATAPQRPSFLDHFKSVVDLSAATSETILRSLIVRGMDIVRIGMEPGSVRTHAVLLDTAHAASGLARQMMLAGHRHILVIEPTEQQTVSNAARLAVQRFAPSVTVSTMPTGDLGNVLQSGATAVLCASESAARLLIQAAESNPQFASLSVAAVGLCDGQPCCTGIYVTSAELAEATAGLLADGSIHRPTTLWLSGQLTDRATVKAVSDPILAAQAA